MKPRIKILIIGAIVLVFLYTLAFTFLALKGKAIIIQNLKNITQKDVTIGYLDLSFPFNLEIKKLNIEGLVKADSVSISPGILGFLTGKIALNSIKIIRPVLDYQRVPPPQMIGPAATMPSAVTAQPKKKRPLQLILKRIIVRDGQINFIDHTVGPEGIRITFKDINFNLTNLYIFTRSVITSFDLKGKIPWQLGKEEGKIEAEGWLNLYKKDMQATLKIENIDGLYLYPYYSKWVDLEKARIEKATLNFNSNINGLNNNIVAECHLELSDIVRKPLMEGETQEKAARIADTLLDIFRVLNQGKIVLDFTVRTKMDRPEFGFANIKMAFEEKLAQKKGGFRPQDILMLPGKLIEGTVKGATDFSKSVIAGTFAIGFELKKAVEDTFKKEPAKEKKE
jgi:hypothetical protein